MSANAARIQELVRTKKIRVAPNARPGSTNVPEYFADDLTRMELQNMNIAIFTGSWDRLQAEGYDMKVHYHMINLASMEEVLGSWEAVEEALRGADPLPQRPRDSAKGSER